MDFYWIYDYPTWMLFIGLISFFCMFSILGVFTLRIFTDGMLGVREEDNAIVSEYMGVTGIFFGLVLGMVAVGSWEAYRHASEVAANEASTIGVFYRSVELLPEEQGAPVKAELKKYVRSIIDQEWPAQQAGRVPSAGEEQIDSIGQLLYAIPVETPRDELAIGSATGFFFDMLKSRRDRIQTVSNSALPGSLWWVVVASTGMIISLSMLMRIENVRLDITINVLMSILTGSILSFIISMDNPYRGELSVRSASYEIIYDQQMNK